jgi:imidazole glycerol-phosphate synthase subunit HisH
MKVGLINFGMGNLGSVRRAIEDLGAEVVVADSPAELSKVNRIVLPGVGAFSEGMARLQSGGWVEVLGKLVHIERKPLLGICLGMQMLATTGDEGENTSAGLGFIQGSVRRLNDLGCQLRIPHVGWNDAHFVDGSPLFHGIPQHSDFYFVHSYALQPDDKTTAIAHTEYGASIVAAVCQKHVFGTQFHPEKSSKVGRQLLRNFLDFSVC